MMQANIEKAGELAARSTSRYRNLLAAEKSVRERLWSSSEWRRLRLEDGVLHEGGKA